MILGLKSVIEHTPVPQACRVRHNAHQLCA
jgi:hypothetical protein